MKEKMLSSAKLNLARLPMFGIAEYLLATQFTFEWTFGLHFKKNITSKKRHNKTSIRIINLVKNINKYDIDLYKFALKLFFKRLKYIVIRCKEQNKKILFDIIDEVKSYSEQAQLI